MDSRGSPSQLGVLIAGLCLNAWFLEQLGNSYYLLNQPVLLAASLFLLSFILAVGVLYLPARLSADGLGDCFGPVVSALIRRILVPAWAALWFAECFVAIGRYKFFIENRPRPNLAMMAVFGLLAFLSIASSAGKPASELAKHAALLAKFSLAAVCGLLLSNVKHVPQVLENNSHIYDRRMVPLEAGVLTWLGPPFLLLATSPALRTAAKERRTLALVALVVAFAAIAGMSTVAGGIGLYPNAGGFRSYIVYASGQPGKAGAFKFLVLAATMILSIGFAASVCREAVIGQRGMGWGIAATAVLLGLAWIGIRTESRVTYFRELAALPFVPLAGVLSGIAMVQQRLGKPGPFPRPADNLQAWILGIAVAGVVPILSEEYTGMSRLHNLWLIAGWMFSCAFAGIAALKRARSSAAA